MSRFLAKVAVEMMAQRVLHDQGMLNDLIDDPQLDQIRSHARQGPTNEWPVNVRRIYPANHSVTDGVSPAFEIVHESDFLGTEQRELYFILAIFGVEMAINMGGPNIEGYEAWLDENAGASPLYYGKNAPGGARGVNPPNT